MSGIFNINDVKPKAIANNKAAVLRDNYLQMHDVRLQTLKELAGRLPNTGEFFALWTQKSFNAFTFIPFLIKEAKIIDNLVVTTYSINSRIIDSLCKKLDDGAINKINLVVSDSLKNRMPTVVDHLEAMAAARNRLQVHYSWNHSKITLASAGGNNYVFEGSGNWSENAQFEQYLLFNHKPLFDFRLNCIQDDLYRRTTPTS